MRKKLDNVIEKYIIYPDAINNLSLYQFVKSINIYGNRYKYVCTENIVTLYTVIDALDESKSEEYYRQQWILQIPFRMILQVFYDLHGHSLDDSWFAIFVLQNLTIVKTDITSKGNMDVDEDEKRQRR